MKIVIISDTHGRHETLGTLEGDVLIHCGDLCDGFGASPQQLTAIDHWFGRQRFDTILCTGGNHDRPLEDRIERGEIPLRNATCLQDEAVTINGVKFYATPWVLALYGWSFYQDEHVLQQKWAQVPDDTDVLITHVPPRGILDLPTGEFDHLGCPHLLARVAQVKPKVHCFGHVHHSYGRVDSADTTFIDASIYSRKGLNRPFVIDWPEAVGR